MSWRALRPRLQASSDSSGNGSCSGSGVRGGGSPSQPASRSLGPQSTRPSRQPAPRVDSSSALLPETRRAASQLAVRLNESLWEQQLSSAVPSVAHTEPQGEALTRHGWQPQPHHLSKSALWGVIVREARLAADAEPMLASFLHVAVIAQPSLERAMAFVLAHKLESPTLLAVQLTWLFMEAYEAEPGILEASVADLQAVHDRDPACRQFLQPLLWFKGFQAIQCQRVAHWMWHTGRRPLALTLQSRMSDVFGVDIHPAARIGRGILLDHATGVVIGETAVVGDNVSLLHHVTLGGSGTGKGVRHPTIGNGVLLGAGTSVLGAVVVGHCSQVASGSVVVTDIPAHRLAVGVPARVIKVLDESCEPMKRMDQSLDWDDCLDYEI